VSLWIYFTYNRVQKTTDEKYSTEGKSVFSIQAKVIRMMPSAGYSLLILPLNLIYRKLATFMTNFGKEIEKKRFNKTTVFYSYRKSSS
jgi:hypothetical protein